MLPGRRAKRLNNAFTLKTGILFVVLFQAVFSDPQCNNDEMCVGYDEQHFSVWYVWFCLLLLLLLILFCMILFCLQCWLKRHGAFSAQRTLTVVTLNDSDPIYVTETSQFPYSGAHRHCQHMEPACSSSVVHLGALGVGEPPSYEDVVKTCKF